MHLGFDGARGLLEIERALVRSFILYTVFWIAVMSCYLSGMLQPTFLRLMFSTGFLLGFLKNLDRAMDEYLESLLYGSKT